MTTYREAVQLLAGLDQDHATEQNGVGFAGSTQYVHDLLEYPRWTREQQERVKKALLLHSKQLAGMGMEYSKLESEVEVENVVAGAGTIDFQRRVFTLSFKFSNEVREALKQSIPGRTWNPDEKVWEAPTSSYESVELFATAWNFRFTEAARQVIDRSHAQPAQKKLTDPLTPAETQNMERFLDQYSTKPSLPPPGAVTVPAKNIVVVDGLFEIRFPYDDAIRLDLKETIPGRYWDGVRKVWTAPLTSEMEVREFAARNDFVLGKSVGETSRTLAESAKTSRLLDSSFMADYRSKSGFALRAYQRAGAEYLVKKERCYLADEPRLGKTIQVLAAIQHLAGQGDVKMSAVKVLVIAPSNIVPVWKEHCAEWLPQLRVRVAPAPPDGANIFITSYDRAQKSRVRLKQERWDVVVVDEAHRIKNRNAARTKAIVGHGDRRDGSYEVGLLEKAKYRWLLTGTPVEKRPAELIQPLTGLGRLEDMGGFVGFATRYCGWVKGVQGSINGTVHSRLPELNQKLAATCFLRREMKDVFVQMPKREFIHVPLQMKNGRRYFAEQARIFERMESETYSKVAGEASLMTLRRIAAEEKVADCIEWATNWLEENEGRKLVLLGWHREPLQAIHQHFASQAVLFIGGQTDREKVLEFQKDPSIRLFVGSILAAGEGIDLSASSDVGVFELPWNYSTLKQGIDRILKPGETTRMGIHYLLAENSVDTEIASLIEQKRKIAEAIHDGRVSTEDDAESVTRLLQILKDKARTGTFKGGESSQDEDQKPLSMQELEDHLDLQTEGAKT